MKLHRLLPLLMALVGLSGCPEEVLCVSGGSSSVPPARPGMILVGKETTLGLVPNLVGGCRPEDVPTPDSLTVEVYDADNQPVEHHSSLGRPSNGMSTLRFTPGKPGRHHVFAAFEPVGGIQQFDLYAALDHSQEATALTLTRGCTSLELTRKGALVCDQTVLRNGTLVQSFPDSRVAVAGDVVWVVNGSGIERYVDSGTALTLHARLGDIHGTPEFLLASESELVVLYDSIIKLVTVSGTALSSTGTTLWTPSHIPLFGAGASGPRVVAVRTGDRLGIVTRTSAGQSNISTRYQVCPHRLESGRFVRTSEPCPAFTHALVGYEPDALWVGDLPAFSEADFTSVRYLQWTATGLVEQASLPLDFNLQMRARPFTSRQTAVPTLIAPSASANGLPLTAVALYSAERRAILMEHLSPELFEASASQRLLWGSQIPGSPPSNGLRVLVRPSAP